MSKGLALIIEDDMKLASIFSYALKEVDFETEVTYDGEAALNRLKEVIPQVIVLDLHLPFISGVEILHFIRDSERLRDVPVMLATADAIIGESLRDQADLVLLKPISVRQLQRLAERLQELH